MTQKHDAGDNPQAAPDCSAASMPGEVAPDGRQSQTALGIRRGVGRLLRDYGFAPLYEMGLANGRRADVMAIGGRGEIWIVEIKSSVADFRCDQKWPDYRDYCDRLFFAVQPSFPIDILPADTGLVLADRFGGEVVRDAPEHLLAPARRKALLLSFARAAALRLAFALDPAAAIPDDIG